MFYTVNGNYAHLLLVLVYQGATFECETTHVSLLRTRALADFVFICKYQNRQLFNVNKTYKSSLNADSNVTRQDYMGK